MWGSRRLAILLGSLFIATSVGAAFVVTAPEASAYTLRGYISITCDLCFTSSNGVTGGSGTPGDPYIIEGWEINASSGTGITIRDTTAYWVIRNVYLHAGPVTRQVGMWLQRAANGRIEDVVIEGTSTGIGMSEAYNIAISRATVTGPSGAGIAAVGGSVSVTNSTIRDTQVGLSLNSWPVRVRGNDIINNSYGISFRGGTDAVIEQNNIALSSIAGVEVEYGFRVTVASNRFTDSAGGLHLLGAGLVTVTGNVFTNNGIQVRGDSLWNFNTHTISPDNLVNGRPVDYRRNTTGVVVDGASIGQLIVANVTDVQVRNLTLTDAETGLAMAYVDRATVDSNTVAGSYESVSLFQVGNLTFSNNVFRGGSVSGQRIFDARFSSNTFTSGGFLLRDGLNYSVADNDLSGNGSRIYTDQSVDVAVTGNRLANGWGGINAWSVTRLRVTGNTLFNGGGVGLAYSRQSEVNANTITLADWGMSVWQSSNITVSANTILRSNRTGIGVTAVADVVLRDNYVALSNGSGIDVGYSIRVRVAHNEFSGNAIPARDDRGSENSWDDGYPLGGNYWSNYSGRDDCSGPQQEVCPDPDGIGDTPFAIDADTQDRYPVVAPLFGNNRPPNASFTVTPGAGTVATSFGVDASSSRDREDSIADLLVRWDWEDDGEWDTAWAAAKSARHSFSMVGVHRIRLQVMDTGGLTAMATRDVNIVNTAPTAAFVVSPASGDVTTEFLANASGSSDLEDAATGLQVRWDWEDDGTWDTPWSVLKIAVHSYPALGSYTIRVEVRDSDALSATTTRTVEILSADLTPPVIVHTPPSDRGIGVAIPITATVTDNRGVTEVVLHYRGVGAVDFHSVPMLPMGGAYAADIPGQRAAGYVAYFITAMDAAGHAARSPTVGEHTALVISTETSAGPRADLTPLVVAGIGAAVATALLVAGLVVLRLRRRAGGRGS